MFANRPRGISEVITERNQDKIEDGDSLYLEQAQGYSEYLKESRTFFSDYANSFSALVIYTETQYRMSNEYKQNKIDFEAIDNETFLKFFNKGKEKLIQSVESSDGENIGLVDILEYVAHKEKGNKPLTKERTLIQEFSKITKTMDVLVSILKTSQDAQEIKDTLNDLYILCGVVPRFNAPQESLDEVA